MSDINQERKKAVREAWKNERGHVRDGKGTRDWSPSEQKQIVAKGRANGYEGHHMKSVSKYPQHAGNPNNIQFLTRSEHLNGAHRGDTKNVTNGYYDPKTRQMHDFGRRNPLAPQSQDLSVPLSLQQKKLAIKREDIKQQAAKQAKSEKKQTANKTTSETTHIQNIQSPTVPSSKSATNKGIESMRNRATTKAIKEPQKSDNKGIESARQKTNAKSTESNVAHSSNQGIKTFQSKSDRQSLISSKVNSNIKGNDIGSGNASGASGSGQSSGSGQGR
jgi:hypothetical protein